MKQLQLIGYMFYCLNQFIFAKSQRLIYCHCVSVKIVVAEFWQLCEFGVAADPFLFLLLLGRHYEATATHWLHVLLFVLIYFC